MEIIDLKQNINNLKDTFQYTKTIQCISDYNKAFSFITSRVKNRYTNDIKYLVLFKCYNFSISLVLLEEEYIKYIEMLSNVNENEAVFGILGKFYVNVKFLENGCLRVRVKKGNKMISGNIDKEELQSYISVLNEIYIKDINNEILNKNEKESLYNEALLCFIDSALDNKNKELFNNLSTFVI